MRDDFGNVITAMVTPFKSDVDQSIDFNRMLKLAEYLLQNGTDTLLIAGSTGEASQLSFCEFEEIIKQIRSYIPRYSKIIVSTGDTNTDRSVLKSQKAFELGANGILVVVPEYIKPTQQVLYRHFDKIAKSINNKPLIIYNIPSRTGTEILPETVAELAKANPNIIGIKQSFGDMNKITELKIMSPKCFQIYAGDDSLCLPMLALGAKGVISVASHLEGRLIQKMVSDFKSGKIIEALDIHNFLYPLYKALFMTTNPMPIKEALFCRGAIHSPVLRTLGEMNIKEKQDIKFVLNQLEQNKEKLYKNALE